MFHRGYLLTLGLLLTSVACQRSAEEQEALRKRIDARVHVAANQVWEGQRAQAQTELAAILKEAPQHPGALMVQTCLQLEQGAEDDAARTAIRLREMAPDKADAIMLMALVEQRRRTPRPGWTEALIEAWKSAGRPSLRDTSRYPEVAMDAKNAVSDVWKRTESVESRLVAVLADHKASEVQQRWLVEHLSELEDSHLLLSAHEYFSDADGLPADLRRQARETVRLKLEAHGAGTNESRIPLLLLMGDASEETPLTHEDIVALDRIASLKHYRNAPLSQRYVDAERRLEAAGASSRFDKAFMVAVANLVLDPASVLTKRAAATKDRLAPDDQDRLGKALLTLGARIQAGNTLVERSVGLRMMEQGAVLVGNEEMRAQVAEGYESIRSVIQSSRQVQIENWPLPSLQREWAKALVQNEWAFLSNLVAP
ncbi:hypothetical protein COCOR_07730 [Corallococcus coralloides DSM 2259]|uniref:Lipoprotein n=1 Tax=Corallococcus coralloides (strain ATCC 25202 / DSM 2259 / NBRC 100086 / M2) TaxID=1144275 RepID=H8MT83_CORCM|nr:hypothetical protein [Corallococcus coralloides]AFE07704.1 hypothetical protein COCOR_07730 [Corallococcus coralloides DSM 2259]